MRRVPGLIIAALAAATLAHGGPGRKQPPALSEWIDGPVRYISTREEAQSFRALGSDDDRALFIERFWSRRDPTPETLVNEYRSLFWQRVQEANASFHGSTRPGWMTDRGKIYILYGPPTEQQEHRDFQSDASIPGGGRGLIRWIYEGRPGGRVDLDPVTVVAFVRDYTGEYRLSSDPRLSSVFFQHELRDRRFERWMETYFTPSRSELAVMLDLGKLQEVPPQEQVILESVETVESYRTQPLRAHLARYRHPRKQGHVAVITIDLADYGARSNPALIAKFTLRDATSRPRMIGEGSFRIEDGPRGRVAQGRAVLEPGVYDLLVLAADPLDIGTALYRGVLVIPRSEGSGLVLSDVTLADRLEPLPYAALASHDEPFLLGPFRVLPRFGEALPRGDTVDLFFEVYGGAAPYRVSYQVQGRDENGSWVDLGQPQVTESDQPAQAWGLPTTERWPLGEYRVRISVEDAAGGLVSTMLPFSLEPAAAG